MNSGELKVSVYNMGLLKRRGVEGGGGTTSRSCSMTNGYVAANRRSRREMESSTDYTAGVLVG